MRPLFEPVTLGGRELASGMRPAPGPEPAGRAGAARVGVIGDAHAVLDISSAVRAGYRVALET
jgi:hypothetical protein